MISPVFRDVSEVRRPVGLYALFYDTDNWAPVDLFCLTPDEFDAARNRISFVRSVLPEAIDLLPASVGREA